MSINELHQIDELRREIEQLKQEQIFFQTELDRHKKRENIWRSNDIHVEDFFNNAAIGFVVVDAEDRFVEVNARMCAMLDYTRDELLDRTVSEITAAEDRAVSHDLNEKLHWGELDIIDYEKRYLKKDGTPLWVHVTVSAVRNEYGHHVYSIRTVEDITKRKEMEEELRTSREVLRSITDNSPDVIARFDLQLRHTFINSYGEKVYGISRGEILGKTNADLGMPADKVAFWNEHFEKVLKTGKQVNTEFDFDSPTLGHQYFLSFFVPERSKEGQVESILAITRDITDLKRTEEKFRSFAEKLQESEERLRLVIEAADLGTWDFDIETGIANHSLRHDQIFGYSEPQPEWSYEISVQHILPEFHQEVRDSVARAIETGYLSYDAKVHWPDGSIHWIAPRGRVYYDKGKPLRMAGIVSDITERKNAEIAVKESEEMFSTMYEVVPIGISIASLPDGALNNVNNAWLEITGFSNKGEVLGKTTAELGIIRKQNRDPILEEFRQHGRVRNAETSFVNRAGEHRNVSINIDTVTLRGQKYLISTNEDITEQKKAELEIRQRNEELTRFIYTVSHDLKSPLVTIKSFTSFLKEDIADKDQEALEKDIRYIENAADKMGKLLDELLELSRVGRKEESKTEVSLQTTVQSAIDLVAGRISSKNVKVFLSAPPVMLYGHTQRLVQLYQNMIDNAVKFMGKQADPVIEIGAFQDKDRNGEVVLFVKDNGQGIDPRYHHKLFGLFEKLDNSTEGTGIGLALVKRIVETHGGSIWFTSEPEAGTTFFFTLKETKILKNH